MTEKSFDLKLPRLAFSWPTGPKLDEVLPREWLLTNGLGGYASGTLAGVNTRRYHGLFIPCLPSPFGRTVIVPRLEEQLFTPRANGAEDLRSGLSGEERLDGALFCPALETLRAFQLRGLMPEWEFEIGRTRIRRRIVMVHGENTLFAAWHHLGGDPIRLRLRPFTTFRFHDRPVPRIEGYPLVQMRGERVEVYPQDGAPPVRLRVFSSWPAPFVSLSQTSEPLLFRMEKARGLDHTETQTSPGYFECGLKSGESMALGLTVAGWESLERDPMEAFDLELEREHRLLEKAPAPARSDTPGRLVLAGDQFVIDPVTRPQDEAWARATGQDARSVIAGYHWFTDWGRDTMISLEGLTLSTGRLRAAEAILRTFQHYTRDGLIPNHFPEGGREALYHTADATLWFFHAIHRYEDVAADLELLRDLFPTLEEIIRKHLEGTRFGIGVDPADGLLRQGAEGYQLTWMDAKVDDWVVTPRRGKTVEINALWFNALMLMADWSERLGSDPAVYREHAQRALTSFNRRFWNPRQDCLFDVVDGEQGNDAAVRPNQIFAISLQHPVLERSRWEPVLRVVERDLATPVGLRTLAPSHPDFHRAYDGDLRDRDAAYHQGTIWPWLVGHYVDAQLKTYGDKARARAALTGLVSYLHQGGVGTIGEIFDATEPYRARGCIAQAWSVAELLRAWLKTSG